MYETFYNLKEKPFTLLPDPDFLYLSEKHRKALTLLEYALMSQAGFTVISGEIGTGKTTLIRHLLNNMEKELTVGLISNTHSSFGELMQWVLLAFNLDHTKMDKVAMYQRFVDFVIGEYAKNRRTVLIIDEAQNMSVETLEELRMLSNINTDKDQALQVILSGQRELRETLSRPELAQFAQRIAVDYHLKPLSQEETGEYIRHRIKVAGSNPGLFEQDACNAVFRYSGGVPRLINLLCDTALVYGYAEQKDRIDAALVTDVAREKQAGGIFPVFDKTPSEADATTIIEEQPPADETSDSTQASSPSVDTRPKKRIRLALCSTPESLRKYLSRLLEYNGIEVVSSGPLHEQYINILNPEMIDILLIDQDNNDMLHPDHLQALSAHGRPLLVYHDMTATRTSLRKGDLSFGKNLADQITGSFSRSQ